MNLQAILKCFFIVGKGSQASTSQISLHVDRQELSMNDYFLPYYQLSTMYKSYKIAPVVRLKSDNPRDYALNSAQFSTEDTQ